MPVRTTRCGGSSTYLLYELWAFKHCHRCCMVVKEMNGIWTDVSMTDALRVKSYGLPMSFGIKLPTGCSPDTACIICKVISRTWCFGMRSNWYMSRTSERVLRGALNIKYTWIESSVASRNSAWLTDCQSRTSIQLWSSRTGDHAAPQHISQTIVVRTLSWPSRRGFGVLPWLPLRFQAHLWPEESEMIVLPSRRVQHHLWTLSKSNCKHLLNLLINSHRSKIMSPAKILLFQRNTRWAVTSERIKEKQGSPKAHFTFLSFLSARCLFFAHVNFAELECGSDPFTVIQLPPDVHCWLDWIQKRCDKHRPISPDGICSVLI